jgi:phosphotransferase system enzyme I (PtsI)
MKNRDPNPALGLRAIRLSFADDHNFRTQVRAILLSHVGNNIDILIPMISGPDEIRRAKTIIDHERSALALCGLDPGDPQIGVMIEIPSAVVLIHEIAAMVDFLCIGTNDLVQYLLAVDRDNESVADWYQTLHPAVIRSIRTVLRAADAMDVPATICGEMGGSSFYTPLLIGLGARDFSMNLNSIAAVRNVIAGISYEECAQVAQLAEACSSANDAEDAIKSFYKEKWPHIFSSRDLDHVAQEGSAASSEK